VSRPARAWADTVDVPPAAKLVLMALAEAAGEDGTGAWCTDGALRDMASRTALTAIRRHLRWLAGEGYVREGDQSRVGEEWRALPLSSRPAVYDLAMSAATRIAWRDSRDPGLVPSPPRLSVVGGGR
jgi:hypothetical protein